MMTTILKMDMSVPWISMNGITDFEITSSLFFKMMKKSVKYSVFECHTKTNIWLCFDMGKRKSKTEKVNQTQGGETV